MPPTVTDIISQLRALDDAFRVEAAPLSGEQELRAVQAKYLGKKGAVSALMKEMGQLPAAERPQVGEVANEVKAAIEAATQAKLDGLAAMAREQELRTHIDVTVPGRKHARGHAHILTQVRSEIEELFVGLGYAVAHGPQVESDFHNFEALGMGQDHPARDMQDTFYLSGGLVLRTHTSPVQIRTMLGQKPPVQIIAPGQVYRRDDDPTHSPMFMQVEGLLVDEGVTMGDLKGTLLTFVQRFFQMDLGLRFRASYFPFVEPGAEVDMECTFCRQKDSSCRTCKGTGWLEIGGAGMVHPVVFGHVGIDPERYSGFAFGMGIERMAMLRHGINDIKLYYEGDLRFLSQF